MNGEPLHLGFANYEEWNRFNETFPVFVSKYAAIEGMRDTVFTREMIGDTTDRVVFGLGWSCFEDFQEIMTLCGNGFGIGALKLLRGMYERQVTAAYLSKNTDQIDDFLDFDFVQRRKAMTNLKRLYPGDEVNGIVSPERQAEIEEEYRAVKRDGRFTETLCDTCEKTRDTMSWSRLSVPDLAQRGGQGLDKFLFPLYIKPTLLSHASLYSLVIKLVENDAGGFTMDTDGQRGQVSNALFLSHFVLLHVFGTQNDHFQLGFEDELEALRQDFRDSWQRDEPFTEADPSQRF